MKKITEYSDERHSRLIIVIANTTKQYYTRYVLNSNSILYKCHCIQINTDNANHYNRFIQEYTPKKHKPEVHRNLSGLV